MMKQPEPHNLRQAMAIINSAQVEDGWASEEEHNRICAELAKLGIMVVVEEEESKDERQTLNARALIADVQIHPWARGRDGNLFNPWCRDAEGAEEAGWNVHSFAPNGQGGGEIVHDDDFADYTSALAHGEALAQKYGVPLRRRTLIID